MIRGWIVAIGLALATGVGAGYVIWGWPTNWYARDVNKVSLGLVLRADVSALMQCRVSPLRCRW